MRSQAREAVFKYIYSRLFNTGDEGLFDVLCKDLKKESKIFAQNLLASIDSNLDKYLEKISELSHGYQLNRVFEVDKCVLILGMAELDNFRETDVPIVIDQAVNISAKYSTESSTGYVNGILAEYAKEL